MVYFDHNATTPLSPVAREAWLQANEKYWQNPSSPYRASASARNHLEDCRERLAARFGVSPQRVVFTSGATESTNAVIRHFARTRNRGSLLAWSGIEHSCVLEPARAETDGIELPVKPEGVLDLEAFGELLKSKTLALVCVQAANNETGVLQPWSEMSGLCREHGIPFHCDAAQWVGKLPLDGLSACDFVTASAHKFYGPKGCGFAIVSEDETSFRGLLGGAQENRRRGGTENVPAISAMVAALEDAQSDNEKASGEASARDAFEARVTETIPGTQVAGKGSDRLSNTSMLIMPAHAAKRWVPRLDRKGFAASTGSACSSLKKGGSHVLKAMGFSHDESLRAIRVSSGRKTGEEDWQALAKAFAEVWDELQHTPEDTGNATVIEI